MRLVLKSVHKEENERAQQSGNSKPGYKGHETIWIHAEK